jgi:hypothetical protein
MEEEKEGTRVIRVFDNVDDVIKDIRSHKDEPGMLWSLGEDDFLMNVANLMCQIILQYEAGLISKDEMDLYLGKKDGLTDVNPLDFNFLFVSTINGCTYTSRPEYIDEKDLDDTYSKILELYSELSIIYSFDSIIDQIQKMVTDFKAAHEDFDKMTQDERVERFCSWNGGKEYMKEVFFVSLLDKCKKVYAILNHEFRRTERGH